MLLVPNLIHCISVLLELISDDLVNIIGGEILGAEDMLQVLVDERGATVRIVVDVVLGLDGADTLRLQMV